MILTLSILVAVIVVGVVLIYIYYQKMTTLLKQQQSFIDGFTHELKTPVTSLKLLLETLKKHELTKEERTKYIDIMIQDTDRLSDNVQQILNMAKLEDRKIGEEFIIGNIGDFIIEKCKGFSRSNDSNEIEVLLDDEVLKSDMLMVKYHPQLFEMLLTNIISNGLRYNENEKPRVEIQFRVNLRSIDILLKDNGLGIDLKERKKIFKKFYQINKSAKGSGVGLYIAQLIAKYHRTKISVVESSDRGTTFCISMPRLYSSKGY